ncbi:MAG: hypothetical protein VB934_13160 [Polyangiaceae bacterium]
MFRSLLLTTLSLLFLACAVHGPSDERGLDDSDDGTGAGESVGTGPKLPSSGAGGSVASGGSAGTPQSATGAVGATSSGATSAQTSTGSGGAGGCYTEAYDTSVSLADLKNGYQGSQWLPTMLTVLDRRYANGHHLLETMKNDPWLSGSLPQYFNMSNWTGLMEAIDTACHEETHGYDFDEALNTPGQHVYFMGTTKSATVSKLSFFARNEILSMAQQGGSVTSIYDSTYLMGTSGSYDFIFLGDELNAYIIGLACATSVGDHITGGHSFRDGVAAHLYYLQLYLQRARTLYPSLYATWKASPSWQAFIRYSWARAHYWTKESKKFQGLGINDQAIWQRVNQPVLLDEIQLFTGEQPTVVACSP